MTVLTKILSGVKNVVVVDVTNVANSFAHDLIDRNDILEVGGFRQIRNGNFAADDDDVALGVSLARDAAAFVTGDAGVEHGVGNSVANFVGMTFADGFGSKDETAEHER